MDYEDVSPVDAYLNQLNSSSRRAMTSAVDSVADILSNGRVNARELRWHELEPQHVSALRGRLLRLYSPATSNRYLSALRGVMKEAWRQGWIDRDSMERAIDVAPVRGAREPRGRIVSRAELGKLFDVCRSDENAAAGWRDLALLALLYGTGIRRAEAANASLDALDLDDGSLKLIGKGDKERRVYLPSGVVDALRRWLDYRGDGEGRLFAKVWQNGRVELSGISADLVYQILRKRHLGAGLKPFTPHDLRRSCISEMLDKGVDIATVAKQVGHSSIQTTARYDRRDEDAQRRAMNEFVVPTALGRGA